CSSTPIITSCANISSTFSSSAPAGKPNPNWLQTQNQRLRSFCSTQAKPSQEQMKVILSATRISLGHAFPPHSGPAAVELTSRRANGLLSPALSSRGGEGDI